LNDTGDTERKRASIRPASRWRWVKYVAGALLSGLLCWILWVVVNRELTKTRGERELADARARLDATDPEWNWDKHAAARQRPPAGKNGADLIPQVKKLARPEWGKEFGKDEWKQLLEVEPNVRYSSRVIEQARRELAESAAAVRLARTLKDCPFGHREIVLKPNVIDTPLQDTQDTRAVVDLLRWDAALAAEDGDRRAADALLALLSAARSIGDEPFLISQLVRMAGRTIAVNAVERFLAQTPDPTGLADLQAALAAEAEEPLLLYAVRGERAALDRLFENMHSGAVSHTDLTKEGGGRLPWPRLWWWHYRGLLPGDHAFALEWLTKYVEVSRRPVHEQPPLVTAIPEPPKDPKYLLSRLLLPAVEKVAHAHWRTTALARCAAVGVASERFRQKHGRWPEALDELVPAFLPAVPLDPYDGQPLRYGKWADGVAVYSVGKKPKQSHGFEVPAEPGKPGLPEGVEFGFRLWNPEKRRLPPLPDPPANPIHDP
jgi:hypothetical protein